MLVSVLCHSVSVNGNHTASICYRDAVYTKSSANSRETVLRANDCVLETATVAFTRLSFRFETAAYWV